MKTKTLIYIATILFLSSGCGKDEPIRYSCNDEIDCWVRTNLNELAGYNRDDLIKFPVHYLHAAYGSFSAKKRMDLWVEKYNTMLSKFAYSEAEKSFILEILDFIKIEHLTTEAGKNAALDFSIRMSEKAKNQLRWDEIDVFAALETLYFKDEMLMLAQQEAKSRGGGTNSCGCRSDVSCWTFVFTGGDGDCVDGLGGCKATDDCCGFLGNLSCTGDCQ